MDFVFVDRESAYPNKYLVTPENGSSYYVILERADEPVVVGTPLNAETFNNLIAALKALHVPNPATAAVGQFLRISAVDANGVVTAVEAVDTIGDIEKILDSINGEVI